MITDYFGLASAWQELMHFFLHTGTGLILSLRRVMSKLYPREGCAALEV